MNVCKVIVFSPWPVGVTKKNDITDIMKEGKTRFGSVSSLSVFDSKGPLK